MQDYLMIGTVLKPQGIRGEVKIKPYAARVEMFSSWKELYLEDRGAYTPVPLKVTRIHEGFVYAFLAGSSSADDAESFRGRDLYIDRAHAAPPENGAVYIADLIGCEAADEDGNPVGVLTDVLQYASDFNRDGQRDINDVTAIQMYLADYPAEAYLASASAA